MDETQSWAHIHRLNKLHTSIPYFLPFCLELFGSGCVQLGLASAKNIKLTEAKIKTALKPYVSNITYVLHRMNKTEKASQSKRLGS